MDRFNARIYRKKYSEIKSNYNELRVAKNKKGIYILFRNDIDLELSNQEVKFLESLLIGKLKPKYNF